MATYVKDEGHVAIGVIARTVIWQGYGNRPTLGEMVKAAEKEFAGIPLDQLKIDSYDYSQNFTLRYIISDERKKEKPEKCADHPLTTCDPKS